ncbi:MoaD/ThiS family protein [Vogesella sp. LIG4]|uniref:MoaD/ThiS family protein n=1 Tax=Vogesella sp. LIG4 TaxID=1192162 RepID=UPI0008201507|nr:MoaD/ThiS family protein [Vogesella sp. LIG4]SCK23610.1 molybdopterin synthase subunit MoaD [Vogesella sp. LIG4]
MSIRILYFGRLKDALGRGEETLDWAGGDTAALLAALRGRGADWAEALAAGKVFRLVVNQQVVRGEVMIPDGAEVGILPPVTGG